MKYSLSLPGWTLRTSQGGADGITTLWSGMPAFERINDRLPFMMKMGTTIVAAWPRPVNDLVDLRGNGATPGRSSQRILARQLALVPPLNNHLKNALLDGQELEEFLGSPSTARCHDKIG